VNKAQREERALSSRRGRVVKGPVSALKQKVDRRTFGVN
jgi:hypothetical protein